MRIRKAKKEDFEEVFLLLKQLWPKEKLSHEKIKKIYYNLLQDKNSLEFVLEENKKVIGYSSVAFRLDIQSNGKIGYLSELIIDNGFRGKGYGSKLLKEIIKISKKLGCKEIQFPSTFKRKKAHKFYQSLGFNKTAYFFWKEI